ncbi:hypothetical protein P3447_27120, partial [Vibrio parahaemolyticus]|nr:hypothetical protein [Vibrio parahaemolyticus]
TKGWIQNLTVNLLSSLKRWGASDRPANLPMAKPRHQRQQVSATEVKVFGSEYEKRITAFLPSLPRVSLR